MATLVHLRVGERAFGVSAGEGEICLTLRAERLDALEWLEAGILAQARALSARDGLVLSVSRQDEFPDTVCPAECVSAFAKRAEAAGLCVKQLNAPMRWSEDFGWYLKHRPGVFFGLGIGEAHAALHTPEYAFDDTLIPLAARALVAASL